MKTVKPAIVIGLNFLLSLCLLLMIQSCDTLKSLDKERIFSGGNGSESNPYQVSNIDQLQLIGQEKFLDKHFIQINDIDASPSTEFQNGSGFKRIGDKENPFTGVYDGNGYKIKYLRIHFNKFDEQIGLFGYMKNGKILNVTLDNHTKDQNSQKLLKASLMEDSHADFPEGSSLNNLPNRGTGSLAGWNVGGIISNCSFSGYVSSHAAAGGLVGVNTGLIEDSYFEGTGFGMGGAGLAYYNSGKIVNSYASGNFSGQMTFGLVTINDEGGEIINSYSNAELWGSNGAAGLVRINEGLIYGSYAIGEVSGHRGTAGLVLENNGEIIDSYSLAAVNATALDSHDVLLIGGLVGNNLTNGRIENSYAAGPIIISGEHSEFGAVAGVNEGTLAAVSVYWDIEITGQSKGVGTGNPDGATGLTTDQMTGPAAEINMPEFDWSTVWRTTDGYPVLRWQQE